VFLCNLFIIVRLDWLGIYRLILSFMKVGVDYGLVKHNIHCNKCLLNNIILTRVYKVSGDNFFKSPLHL